MTDDVKKAIDVLKNGGIVVFPTDTAFGIGCRIDNTKVVDRLFELRKRPRTKPTPVLISSKAQALEYFDNPNKQAQELMDAHWPGALTIIDRCKKNMIYSPIRGNGNTVGLRMPDHDDLLEVIQGVGVPILGPSANFHGEKTPFVQADLDKKLLALVDYVLPGVCKAGNVSTVVDCTTEPYTVVRQGAVTL